MAVKPGSTPLENVYHERFCLNLAQGMKPPDAYRGAGYGGSGAAASAARLLKNANLLARLSWLRERLTDAKIEGAISRREARVAALQDRWDRMRRVIEERGISPDYAGVPGGSTGLLCRDYKGKDAQAPIYRVDVGLLVEMRMTEKQAAQELGQWSEEPQVEKQGLKFEGTFEELLVLYRRVTAAA